MLKKIAIAEKIILKIIQNNSLFFNAKLFRNNVGMFNVIEKNKRRVVKTGLCKGSSDLIGYTTKVITQEMVGKSIAIFTAVEVKKSDWKKEKKFNEHEEMQKNFLENIINDGGLAGFATDIEDFKKIIIFNKNNDEKQ